MSNSHSVIAIIGRSNVGKSTLFNRLVGNRLALVEKSPGVTRDRNYGISKYCGFEFVVIDTGGFEFHEEDFLIKQMKKQAFFAIEEADCVLFLVNAQEGWTPSDGDLYRTLTEKKNSCLYVVANKADNPRLEKESFDLFRLGVDKIFPISCEHNKGIDTLLEEINKKIPIKIEDDIIDSVEKKIIFQDHISVSVIGKPNAGKSSLVNSLLKEDRMIVDSISGTTRDSVDSYFKFNGKKFMFVDTAGIRRRGKVSNKIETFSIVSALKSIERSDVVLLIIDAKEGITDQVMKIAGYAYERSKSIIIVMNKCDLIKNNRRNCFQIKEELHTRLNFIKFAPILFVSAKTGQSIPSIYKTILRVFKQYIRRIQTSDLNSILNEIVNRHPPPSKSGRPTKIYYGNQISVAPPKFVFMTNNPEKTNVSYERYFSNQFRSYFGFEGTPIKFIWRKKK